MTFTQFGKEQEVVVVGGNEHVLDKILPFGFTTSGSAASTALLSVFCYGSTLDISGMRNRDDDLLIRNNIFHIDLTVFKSDFSTAFITIFLLYLEQLIPDDAALKFYTIQDSLQPLYKGHGLFVFLPDFISFKTRKLLQPHFKDGLGLNL